MYCNLKIVLDRYKIRLTKLSDPAGALVKIILGSESPNCIDFKTIYILCIGCIADIKLWVMLFDYPFLHVHFTWFSKAFAS